MHAAKLEGRHSKAFCTADVWRNMCGTFDYIRRFDGLNHAIRYDFRSRFKAMWISGVLCTPPSCVVDTERRIGIQYLGPTRRTTAARRTMIDERMTERSIVCTFHVDFSTLTAVARVECSTPSTDNFIYPARHMYTQYSCSRSSTMCTCTCIQAYTAVNSLIAYCNV